ncbi:MAG: helix-turn-helix domain-containing protein [Puniceicoccaceae bacterium]
MKPLETQHKRKDGRSISTRELREIRATAIRRVVEDNESPSAVMKSMGLCRTTIYPWLKTYYREGSAAVSELAPRGRKPTLSNVQKMALRMRMLSDDIAGAPRLWNVEAIQREVEDLWDMRISKVVARRILSDMGFYPGSPTRTLLSKADHTGRLWIKCELPKAVRKAEAEGRQVFWFEWLPGSHDKAAGRLGGDDAPCCDRNEAVLLATNRKGGFFCHSTDEAGLGDGIVALGNTVLANSRRCLLIFVNRLPALDSPVVRRWTRKAGDAVKILCCDRGGEDCCPPGGPASPEIAAARRSTAPNGE